LTLIFSIPQFPLPAFKMFEFDVQASAAEVKAVIDQQSYG
jgi:hypothetical protein